MLSQKWWDTRHLEYTSSQEILRLGNSALKEYVSFLGLNEYLFPGAIALEVGVGTGRATVELSKQVSYLDALDISSIARLRVKSFCRNSYGNPEELVSNTYDLIVCFLVAQHLEDEQLVILCKNATRALKLNGVMLLQFAYSTFDPSVLLHQLEAGCSWKTPDKVQTIVNDGGGRIIKFVQEICYKDWLITDINSTEVYKADIIWGGAVIGK